MRANRTKNKVHTPSLPSIAAQQAAARFCHIVPHSACVSDEAAPGALRIAFPTKERPAAAAPSHWLVHAVA